MDEITVCHFVNKAKENVEENLTLYAEWKDFECKIYVIGNGKCLTGQLSVSDFDKFAVSRSKPAETCFQETKNIFSGADATMEFFLGETTLKWCRKHWRFGVVELSSIDNLETMLEIAQKVLRKYACFQDSLEKLKTENSNLKSLVSKLKTRCDDIVVSKNNIEADLYKKFLVLLNSKKKRIRELENHLKKETVFEEETDDEIVEKKKHVKRQFEEQNSSETRTKITKSEPSTVQNKKTFHILEESDTEIELKLLEESSFEPSTSFPNKSIFTAVESEDDFFSQSQ